MGGGTVEIITGRERRRRWSSADKLRVLAECDEPGASVSAVAAHRELIGRLRLQLARLRRARFGRSSERLSAEADQLELALEDPEADAPAPSPSGGGEPRPERRKPARRPLPEHLPRETVEHGAGARARPACGGALRRPYEDAAEVLDYVPGRFRVVRHVRPRWSCRCCEAVTQAPAPSLPIPRGRATAGLLAHVLVAKYADHLPLYRQSAIYAREGVALERSTLADWVGRQATLLRPLVDALARHVTAGGVLHADDAPVPMLAPGTGGTSTGRLWAYLRNERPHAGGAPPAVLYRYSPDRRTEHPRICLKGKSELRIGTHEISRRWHMSAQRPRLCRTGSGPERGWERRPDLRRASEQEWPETSLLHLTRPKPARAGPPRSGPRRG